MKKIKYNDPENPRCEILKAMKRARPASRRLCLVCKGSRLLCNQGSCPLLNYINIRSPVENKLSDSLFGPSTSVFVGWKLYPDVFVGPMTSINNDDEKAMLFDNPGQWYGQDINDIIMMRSSLVRSKARHNIYNREKFILDSQEIALSVKPTDVEIKFKKKPHYSLSFSAVSQPMGPSGIVERVRITENTSIPKAVDCVVSDDLKAEDMMIKLKGSGFDVYYLTNVMASGALGMEQRKKLVPTRWSITAVDDILGKFFIKNIKNYPAINDYRVYRNEYLSNHFEILLMPGAWEFEQFEAWAPNTLWTLSRTSPVIVEEHEGHEGRSDYALNEGGGYYAGRLAACEALNNMRRQARTVIFREIYEGYIVPVGVWEVRENVRQAFKNPPGKFSTLKEALEDIKSHLALPLEDYMKKSEILRQRRLSEY